MARDVFHSCPADERQQILAGGMRPSQCEMCRRDAAGQPLAPLVDHDSGFFGDHTKGVYVSKHADYTFKYFQSPPRRPVVGQRGAVVMLETVTGRVRHLAQRRDGERPTPGFDCHESPNHLEYYVWDGATQAEPPRCTGRVVPRFVVHWRAVQGRGNIADDQ